MAKTQTNTAVVEANKLQKPDVADVIFNISPEKTPVQSLIGTTSVDSSRPKWNADAYAAPNPANANEPGYKATFSAVTDATEYSNHSQIFALAFSVDDRLASAKVYGNYNKVSYIKAKKVTELRRDLESALLGSTAAVAMADNAAGKLAGFGALVKTCTAGDGQAPSGYNASTGAIPARTILSSGSRKAITTANIDDVLEKRFTETGEDSMSLTVFLSMKQKNNVKNLYTAADRIDRVTGNGEKVTDTINIISTNAGDIKLKPHYMLSNEYVLFVDPAKASVGIVNKFRTFDLAKTGASTDFGMDLEATLKITDEKAHGAIYGLK